MQAVSKILIVGSCGLSTACATTPDMQLSYFHSKSLTQFKAIETLGCDKDFNVVDSINGEITTKYSADRSGPQVDVPIKRLDGQLSDADLSFDFYDDGRLKGLNAETTGQGEAIIKSAATVFKNVILAVDGGVPPEAKADCEKIAQWVGDKKVVTLTFVGETDFSEAIPDNQDAAVKPLKADTNSGYYASNLKSIGSICAAIGRAPPPKLAAMPLSEARVGIKLELRQPAVSVVEIRKYSKPDCKGFVMRSVTSAEVQVPQMGTPQYIILPKAAVFGKQAVALTLSDAGTITKLKYGKTNGVASAINATGAALDVVDETRAERLSRLKEEADLIVAQERLVRCMASEKDCK